MNTSRFAPLLGLTLMLAACSSGDSDGAPSPRTSPLPSIAETVQASERRRFERLAALATPAPTPPRNAPTHGAPPTWWARALNWVGREARPEPTAAPMGSCGETDSVCLQGWARAERQRAISVYRSQLQALKPEARREVRSAQEHWDRQMTQACTARSRHAQGDLALAILARCLGESYLERTRAIEAAAVP